VEGPRNQQESGEYEFDTRKGRSSIRDTLSEPTAREWGSRMLGFVAWVVPSEGGESMPETLRNRVHADADRG
jgi:hypothetical protein